MTKTFYFNGVKVNAATDFNCVGLNIIIKRRVGQSTKLFFKGEEVLWPNRNYDYDVYNIVLDSTSYQSITQLVKDVMKNVEVQFYINEYSHRYSYELLRALS